jgi:hypothetical protein
MKEERLHEKWLEYCEGKNIIFEFDKLKAHLQKEKMSAIGKESDVLSFWTKNIMKFISDYKIDCNDSDNLKKLIMLCLTMGEL